MCIANKDGSRKKKKKKKKKKGLVSIRDFYLIVYPYRDTCRGYSSIRPARFCVVCFVFLLDKDYVRIFSLS